MKKIVFLGIGSNSFGALSTSSIGVNLSATWLLIDCGPDIPRQLRKAGIQFLNVSTLVVTHRHLDHCLGIPYLLFGRNLEALALKAETPSKLTIVCERDLFDQIITLFQFCHPDVPKFAYELQHEEIRRFCDESVTYDSHSLRFTLVNHAVPTYACRISAPDGTALAYSSDTLPTDSFSELAKGATVLVHEAMFPAGDAAGIKTKHSTAAEAGEVARTIKPKRGFLIHLLPVKFKDRADFERQASEISGVRMEYPEEGKVYSWSELE